MAHLGRAVPDLSARRRQAELMDDPDLERDRHLQALHALARVNRVSLVARRLWRQVVELQARLGRPVRVLDLACGGGDVLVGVAARARAAGARAELHGCDVSPVAVERARRAVPSGAAVDVFVHDVVRDDLPKSYDLLASSLFLHHLEPAEAVSLLRRMSEATRVGLFVEDLRRTRLGYVFAWIGLHTLTRSEVARVDGLRSVRAAFTLDEVRSLCAEAGLPDADVRAAWPQRLTVAWTKEPDA